MCRLLAVASADPFAIAPYLDIFAGIAERSEEYQGHGWGCAWRLEGAWRTYHNIAPVWEDRSRDLGETTLLLAHARSAFRDEGIRVENNMPFVDGERAFIFNGELRGVRIKEQGRIGAEKIFNYIQRLDAGDLLAALTRAAAIIERRTRYLTAMNLVLAERDRVLLCTRYNERPRYFQMHRRLAAHRQIVCSEPFPDEPGWEPIANGTVCAMGVPP
jgi:glutamine amidotransferase